MLVLLFHGQAFAGKWQILQTKYLKISYEDVNDLKKFSKKIKFSGRGSFSSFSGSSSKGSGFENKLASKTDALFEKVQLILDMRKPMKKVRINLYPNKSALQKAYYKIYKKKRGLRAWYIFEYNTIFINVQDVFAGMLAHEIAHAIVDHYLAIKPPRATAEILARYVDTHLNKKPKTY
jgi:hypothetical protein